MRSVSRGGLSIWSASGAASLIRNRTKVAGSKPMIFDGVSEAPVSIPR